MNTQLKQIVEDYVSYWKQMQNLDYGQGPFIHPKDGALAKKNEIWFRERDASKYDSNTDFKKIHVDLLPSPYMGDLLNAKIYFFMLNPGFAGNEYDDHRNKHIWHSLVSTLKQDYTGNPYLEQYKFLFLHPEFQETEGGVYIKRYLKNCISDYQKITGSTDELATQVFANNICFIQAFPYHSEKYRGLDSITRKLISHQKAKDFLLSVSNDTQKLVYIVRGYRFFGHKVPANGRVIPFTKVSEYGSRYFPFNQEWEGVKHGDRLVNHLRKWL